MSLNPESKSKAQRFARYFGFVLLFVHAVISAQVATSFGKPGSEWWPILYYLIDFPVSIPVIWASKWLSDWPLWFAFLISGSLWHFYWPQGLTWVIRRLINRFKRTSCSA